MHEFAKVRGDGAGDGGKQLLSSEMKRKIFLLSLFFNGNELTISIISNGNCWVYFAIFYGVLYILTKHPYQQTFTRTHTGILAVCTCVWEMTLIAVKIVYKLLIRQKH